MTSSRSSASRKRSWCRIANPLRYPESPRPRVICHMAASVDGRIVADKWPDAPAGLREYEQIHASYAADGWRCGRVTMEPFAGGLRSDAGGAREYAGTEREGWSAHRGHVEIGVP